MPGRAIWRSGGVRREYSGRHQGKKGQGEFVGGGVAACGEGDGGGEADEAS
ncbi:MAG: hypothetical protein IIC21_04380 [Chloroflexi bacterium]|nr:hypothetical protein [Chloroflexota bacterium]